MYLLSLVMPTFRSLENPRGWHSRARTNKWIGSHCTQPDWFCFRYSQEMRSLIRKAGLIGYQRHDSAALSKSGCNWVAVSGGCVIEVTGASGLGGGGSEGAAQTDGNCDSSQLERASGSYSFGIIRERMKCCITILKRTSGSRTAQSERSTL